MNRPISESINNVDILINDIRGMAIAGCKPTDILSKPISDKGIESKEQLVVLFREAFNLELRDVSCIGGWWNDRESELSDKVINKHLSPHLKI